MLARPWVTTNDVKEYTDHKEVQNRSNAKIKIDIFRAEQKVIAMTHNDFSDVDIIPECVKTAILLIAEAYAKNAIETAKQQIKSETFDDYSYTIDSGKIDTNQLDLDELLKDYIIDDKNGNVTFKIRAI